MVEFIFSFNKETSMNDDITLKGFPDNVRSCRAFQLPIKFIELKEDK